jgi:hypothetical protein
MRLCFVHTVNGKGGCFLILYRRTELVSIAYKLPILPILLQYCFRVLKIYVANCPRCLVFSLVHNLSYPASLRLPGTFFNEKRINDYFIIGHKSQLSLRAPSRLLRALRVILPPKICVNPAPLLLRSGLNHHTHPIPNPESIRSVFGRSSDRWHSRLFLVRWPRRCSL